MDEKVEKEEAAMQRQREIADVTQEFVKMIPPPSVSYTHLDVYKRQVLMLELDLLLLPVIAKFDDPDAIGALYKISSYWGLLVNSKGELKDGVDISDELDPTSFPFCPTINFFKSKKRLSDTSVVFALL